MKVTFWGVRGSLPTPLSPAQVRSKIAAVVHRIRPSDLESTTSREQFLAGLPPSLFGTIGGNTTCLEARTDTILRSRMGEGEHPRFRQSLSLDRAHHQGPDEAAVLGDCMRIGGAEIRWKRMNHPGGSFAYKITDNGRSVIFATDSEVTDREFQQREENRSFFDSPSRNRLPSSITIIAAQEGLELHL